MERDYGLVMGFQDLEYRKIVLEDELMNGGSKEGAGRNLEKG